MPGTVLDKANSGLIDALVAANLAKSKSEARSFIQSSSVAINGNRAEGLEHVIGGAERLYGRFTIPAPGQEELRADQLAVNPASIPKEPHDDSVMKTGRIQRASPSMKAEADRRSPIAK